MTGGPALESSEGAKTRNRLTMLPLGGTDPRHASRRESQVVIDAVHGGSCRCAADATAQLPAR